MSEPSRIVRNRNRYSFDKLSRLLTIDGNAAPLVIIIGPYVSVVILVSTGFWIIVGWSEIETFHLRARFDKTVQNLISNLSVSPLKRSWSIISRHIGWVSEPEFA
jgi:hypothetical protein